jgi:hypothetical protein
MHLLPLDVERYGLASALVPCGVVPLIAMRTL